MAQSVDTQPGFGQQLVDAGAHHGRLCVGIDPHAALLEQWGLSDSVEGLREFSRICVEAFAGHVALVKPQVAFFERFGSRGFAVLEETLAALRERDTLVVADAKRGDIGSTMAGYADAWLAPGSPLEADAVTLTPYLGVGSLEPAIELAAAHGKGVFVMSANSNPEAEAFQSSLIGERTVAQYMVDGCAAYNDGAAGSRWRRGWGDGAESTRARAPQRTGPHARRRCAGRDDEGRSSNCRRAGTAGVSERVALRLEGGPRRG